MSKAKTWAKNIAALILICLITIPYGVARFRLDEADAAHNQGLALYYHGRYDEAIRQFQKETRIVPYYSGAYDCWGMALEKQGHVAEAIALYHKALVLNPNNVRAQNNLAGAFAKQVGKE